MVCNIMWRRNLLLHWKSYSKIVHRNTHSNWDRQNYLPTNLQLLIHILLWESENERVCTCIPPPSSSVRNSLWISMCFFLFTLLFFFIPADELRNTNKMLLTFHYEDKTSIRSHFTDKNENFSTITLGNNSFFWRYELMKREREEKKRK